MIDLPTARLRARLLAETRDYFSSRGFLEADTPHFAPQVIPEPTIELFASRFSNAYGEDREIFLLPSPEYWLKKLIAEFPGTPLFQLARCFRNREQSGRLHNIEFSMLEWYKPEAGYRESAEETEELIRRLCGAAGVGVPGFRTMSMEQAFRQFAGLELAPLTEDTVALREALQRRGIASAAEDSWNDLFQRLFITLVEPELPDGEPLFLYDYPARIACLAREKAGTPWRERWELYWKGVELANCYTELTDAAGVRALLAGEAEEKRRSAAVDVKVDEEYWRTFTPPYPRSSGVALGFDRLLMLIAGKESLADVIYFPFSNWTGGEFGNG
jgi:elongation factor P--(R)-beta-lysine ligase